VTEDELNKLANAIIEHGNQLGINLVHFKGFLERLQGDQQTFLSELQAASDRTQRRASRAAVASAIAAIFAAAAAGAQTYTAWEASKQPAAYSVPPPSTVAVPNK
jgi:hypothetical protein